MPCFHDLSFHTGCAAGSLVPASVVQEAGVNAVFLCPYPTYSGTIDWIINLMVQPYETLIPAPMDLSDLKVVVQQSKLSLSLQSPNITTPPLYALNTSGSKAEL